MPKAGRGSHVLAILCLVGGCHCPIAPGPQDPRARHSDIDVIVTARRYADGGGYRFTGTGSPSELRARGEVVLAAGDEGTTYCSGFTFAVAWRVGFARGLLQSKSPSELHAFQRAWYGADGDSERLLGPAMESFGVGRSVPSEACEPGDFVQFWRGRTGHSAVFLGWNWAGGIKPAGFAYRSSQASTNGIGDKDEYFGDALDAAGMPRGEVDRARMYCARMSARATP